MKCIASWDTVFYAVCSIFLDVFLLSLLDYPIDHICIYVLSELRNNKLRVIVLHNSITK